MNPRETESWGTTPAQPGSIPVCFRVPVRDADPEITHRGRQALPAHRLSHVGRAHGLLLRRDRHHARDGDAPDWHRLAISLCFLDANKQYFDGAKTYKVTLPQGHSGRQNSGRLPCTTTRRARCSTRRSATHARVAIAILSPAAAAERRRFHDCLLQSDTADGVKRGNWIQTMPGKGWFTILRLYSPLEPFFTKQWRPSEIDLVP